MKIKILCSVATALLLAGCTESRQHMGAASDNDHNVLTGGPITGTTLKDLPQPVKDTLQKQVPQSEIADIDKLKRNGQIVYQISFTEPGKNPKVYITQDGKVLDQSEVLQK
jgi:hypothetical protein